jgi:hypothetical protein
LLCKHVVSLTAPTIFLSVSICFECFLCGVEILGRLVFVAVWKFKKLHFWSVEIFNSSGFLCF